MNRRWSGDKKKSVLTPTLSSEERETLFPRLVNLSALHLHWFRGSKREIPVSGKSHAGRPTLAAGRRERLE
jgi:hypothetical protein